MCILAASNPVLKKEANLDQERTIEQQLAMLSLWVSRRSPLPMFPLRDRSRVKSLEILGR